MPEEPVKHDSQPHSGGADIATGPAKDPGLPTKSPTLRSGASHYDTDEVILRAETLSKVEAKVTSQAIKRLLTFTRLYLWLAWVVLAIDLGFKAGKDQNYLLTVHHVEIWNLVYCVVCLIPMLYSLAELGGRMRAVRKRNLRWTQRRKTLSILGFIIAIAQIINLLAWLAQNILVLAIPCSWFAPEIVWLSMLQWTCYNSMFLVYCMQAHNLQPTHHTKHTAHELSLNGGELEPCIGDRGWLIHLPKCLLWVVFESLLIALGVYILQDKIIGVNLPKHPTPGCHVFFPDCTFDPISRALTATVMALFLVYVALWAFYIIRAQARLKKKSYQKNRVLNVALRVQKRSRAWSFALFAIMVVLIFFWRPNSCASYLLNWLGLAPAQFLLTGLAANGAWWLMPHHPNSAHPVLQEWLEAFSWTEDERDPFIARRNARSPDCEALANEPMFCYETAAKCFYWSYYVYIYSEDEAKEAVKDQDLGDYTLKTALDLYSLDQYNVLWEAERDDKCILAWSKDNLILCAFKGTSSMQNVITDLQVTTSHLPGAPRTALAARWLMRLGIRKRGWTSDTVHGRSPAPAAVHKGFLRSWELNGFKARLLARVQELVAGMEGKVTIILTGHSLGGALATLASYDLKQVLPDRAQLSCYTFGAPRTGNHAFAQQYSKVVGDSWDLINDQDAISRWGKFLTVYKRPGHRVIINHAGDLIVRPSFVEASYQRKQFGSSVPNHMLESYQRSLAQIAAAQFRGKGFAGADQKVVTLLSRGALQRVLGPFAEDLHRPGELARHSVAAHSSAKDYLNKTSQEDPARQHFKLVLDQPLEEVVTEVSKLHEAAGHLVGPGHAERLEPVAEDQE